MENKTTNETAGFSHDVFISFAFKDQELVDKIVNHLTNFYGISCWICTEEIRAGENFREDIAKAIRAAGVVVLVQSTTSAESAEVTKEVLFALKKGKTVKPFMIENSQLNDAMELQLADIHHIDATERPIDAKIKDLARDICLTLGKEFVCSKPENSSTLNSTPAYNLKSHPSTASKYFYGRDNLLKEIHSTYESGNRIIFLRGMGGIGKSEIAKHYAQNYSDSYKTVIFARYTDSLLSLIADDTTFAVEGLCRKVKQNKELQTDEEYAADKIEIIRKICTKETLIIIDNYDVEFDPYLEELVKSGDYRLLITTRCDQERGMYSIIPITEITDDDALKEIVIKYCEPEYVFIDKDDPTFDELFKLTMRHTFALELVAQYMEETSTELCDMVELLKEHGLQQLSNTDIIHHNQSSNAYEIIQKLFDMTELSVKEKKFLQYLCLMPEAGISQEYFKKWCESDVYTQSRIRLLKRSLVKYDFATKILSMHPLVRESALSSIKPTFNDCSVFLNNFANDLVDYISWNYPASQKDVLFNCCKNIQSLIPEVTADNFNLYFHMVNFSCFVDDIQNSIKNLRMLIDKAKSLFGEDSAQEAKLLHRLGWCYYACDERLTSLNILENQAYPMLEKNFQDVPGEYIHCCCDIAKLYFLNLTKPDSNYNKISEEYLKKSLAVIEDNNLAENHPIVEYRKVLTWTSYSSFLDSINKTDEAMEYCLKALNKAELLHIENDKSAIEYILGQFYIRKKEYHNAINSFINSVSKLKKYSRMLDSASTQNERFCKMHMSLSECYSFLNDTEKAREHISEAYKTAQMIYYEDHPLRKSITEKYNLLHNQCNN